MADNHHSDDDGGGGHFDDNNDSDGGGGVSNDDGDIGAGTASLSDGEESRCPRRESYEVSGLSVLRIRIHRIHMFLGLLDPDPLVRGMGPVPDPALDPDPDPSIIMQKKTLIPTILRLFSTFYL
jgi:hypothetical protein